MVYENLNFSLGSFIVKSNSSENMIGRSSSKIRLRYKPVAWRL